jgi:hypothetical protein
MKRLPGHGRRRLQWELVRAGLLVGAEIGVAAGEHAETLLRAGVRHLTLVDQWSQEPGIFDPNNPHDQHHQSNYEATQARMKMFPGQVEILRGNSVTAARHVAAGALDFVYIDADHRAEAVRADLVAWYDKVRPGGWVCGHDFVDVPGSLGVETVVTQFCLARGIPELFVCPDESHPNWHFVKP